MRRPAIVLAAALLLAACGVATAQHPGQLQGSDSSPSPEAAKSEPGWTTWGQLDQTARRMFATRPPHQPHHFWAELQAEAYNCVVGWLVETYPDRVTADAYTAGAVADWRKSWEAADAVLFSRPLVRVRDDGSAYVVALAAACGGVAAAKPDPQGHRGK